MCLRNPGTRDMSPADVTPFEREESWSPAVGYVSSGWRPKTDDSRVGDVKNSLNDTVPGPLFVLRPFSSS